MIPLWECQACKAKFTRKTDEQLPRHTCDTADPNRYGYSLQVGAQLEPGDDLYVGAETLPAAPEVPQAPKAAAS